LDRERVRPEESYAVSCDVVDRDIAVLRGGHGELIFPEPCGDEIGERGSLKDHN
jgi:hypothetical protein